MIGHPPAFCNHTNFRLTEASEIAGKNHRISKDPLIREGPFEEDDESVGNAEKGCGFYRPGLSVPDHGFGVRKSEQAAPGGGLP